MVGSWPLHSGHHRRLGHYGVNSKPRFWIPVSIVRLDAFRAEAIQPVGLSQSGGEGPNAIDAEWFLALVWRRVSRWSTAVTSVVAALLIIVDAEALTVIVASALLLFFSFAAPPIDDVACVTAMVDGAASIHVSLS